MASNTIRVAMLNAEMPVPNVLSQRGTFGNIFYNLLKKAATRVFPNLTIVSTDYDVREGQYPLTLSDVDVILITGSASSAYDNVEWIHRLDEYVLEVYMTHPHIKLFGSCFGHQLICQSLLGKYGVVVEKDPNGWELGVHEIQITDDFRNTMAKSLRVGRSVPVPDTMRLQMVHADHVKIPSEAKLPNTWVAMGYTKQCSVQGFYEPGRVLTLQGHFEFDRFINSETMKVFGATWKPEVLQQTLDAIDADDDSEVAADMVVQFLTEILDENVSCKVGGLWTPPLEK